MSSRLSSSYEQRLQTFRDWPSTSCQRPQDLAAAGFESEGRGDCVRCPTCLLRLFDWIPSDPLQQHGKFSRHKCDLYRQIVKQKFFEQEATTLKSQEASEGKARERFTAQEKAILSEPSIGSTRQDFEVSSAPPLKYRKTTAWNQERQQFQQPAGQRQGANFFHDHGAPLCKNKFSMNIKMPISSNNGDLFQMNLQFGSHTAQGGFQLNLAQFPSTQSNLLNGESSKARDIEETQDKLSKAPEDGTTVSETSGETKLQETVKREFCENFDKEVADYMQLEEFTRCLEMGINSADLREAIRNRLQQRRDVLMELVDIVEDCTTIK